MNLKERLADLVARYPGVAMTDARKVLNVAWGTLEYHVRGLEGRIEKHSVHGRCLLYPVGHPTVAEEHALLRGESVRRVAEDVLAHPGTDIDCVIRRLGLSERVVYYHVKRLVEAALVRPGPDGGYGLLFPRDRLSLRLEETLRAQNVVDHEGGS